MKTCSCNRFAWLWEVSIALTFECTKLTILAGGYRRSLKGCSSVCVGSVCHLDPQSSPCLTFLFIALGFLRTWFAANTQVQSESRKRETPRSRGPEPHWYQKHHSGQKMDECQQRQWQAGQQEYSKRKDGRSQKSHHRVKIIVRGWIVFRRLQ